MSKPLGLLRSVLVLTALLLSPRAALAQCPAISPHDWTPDDAGLQCRLDAGGTIYLEPGSPGYIVNSGLMLKQHGTRLVSSAIPQLATIIAGQNLWNWILITPPYAINGVEISYVHFDGMVDTPGWRQNRFCQAHDFTYGNVAIKGDGTNVHDSRFTHALCGSGLKLIGSNFSVVGNYVGYNGRDRFNQDAPDPWADGITALTCHGSVIAYNTLIDNTDVDIVTGGGNCNIHHNYIWHGGKYAFAGIHVGWFQEGGGNHSGLVVQDNTIAGNNSKLGMGIAVGFDMWEMGHDTVGGVIQNNNISGGNFNVMIDGAYGVTFQNNSIGSASGGGYGGPGGCWAPGVPYGVNPNHYSGNIQGSYANWYFDNQQCQALGGGGGGGGGGDSELTAGEVLDPGQFLMSPDGRFKFEYQTDGNIVLYQGGAPLWWSGTQGSGAGGQLRMQSDGNLVLYVGSYVPFHTGTYMYPGAKLKIQNDGNAVIYDANGQWRWQSGTCCH